MKNTLLKVIIATNSFSLTSPRFAWLLVKNWKFPDFSQTIWDKIWFPDFSLISLISRLAGNPGKIGSLGIFENNKFFKSMQSLSKISVNEFILRKLADF